MSTENTKIGCALCGAEVHSIQLHLRDLHPDVTLDDYQRRYPASPLMSKLAAERLAARKAASVTAEAVAVAAVCPEGAGRMAMHELFALGRVKAAMNARGEPIPVTVLERGEHADMIPAANDNYVYDIENLKNVLMAFELHIPTYVWGHSGTGKCLGKDTPVLMFNGQVRAVQDVKAGDLVMGPDSIPRRVISTTFGREMLYRVTPTKGDPYVVNESHILSLRMTGGSENNCGLSSGSIVNLPVMEYLNKPEPFKRCAKGWRTGVDFPVAGESLKMDPYFLGLWLGDGNSANPVIWSADSEVKDYLAQYANKLGLTVRHDDVNESSGLAGISICKTGGVRHKHPLRRALERYSLIKNKHIPHAFKTASRQERLELLAGVIDSDGSYEGSYVLTLKSERLLDDVIFVARSLGLAAYKKSVQKTCLNNGKAGTYFKCCISGEIDEIPCRIARKKALPRAQKKNVLNVGITVEPIGEGDYFGFALEGADHLFLLGDFTVTHNTELFEQVCARSNRPWIRVQHTVNTEEAHIIGMRVARSGETPFELGPLALAMKHGWVYLADEYDFAMPSVLSVYQPVLEGKSLVIKEADEENRVIRPHPNFRFCATGNTNGSGDDTGLYQGTNIQNAANYDRFGMVIQQRYMKSDMEAQILVNQAGIAKEEAAKIVDFANRVRESYEGNKISATISPRTLINAARLGMRRANWRTGIALSFTNKLSRVDREAVDSLAQRVFG